MAEKACKECKRIIESGNECPVCKSKDLTSSWRGIIVIYDVEDSDIAEEAGIEAPGRYALRVE